VGFLAFYPLAAGLLSGKARRGEPPPAGSRLALRPDRAARFMTSTNFDKIDAIGGLARDAGRTLADLALAWPLAQPGVTALIVGASSPEQVRANADAAAWRLPDALTQAVAKAAAL
jgi:aryl-alcohol dehydrogenase-like predicted oxidoreductase